MVKQKPEAGPGPGDPGPAEMVGDAPELPYLPGTWHGMAQYRCRECPFDALEEETILEHIAAHLVEEPAFSGGGLILMADKYGNQK